MDFRPDSRPYQAFQQSERDPYLDIPDKITISDLTAPDESLFPKEPDLKQLHSGLVRDCQTLSSTLRYISTHASSLTYPLEQKLAQMSSQFTVEWAQKHYDKPTIGFIASQLWTGMSRFCPEENYDCMIIGLHNIIGTVPINFRTRKLLKAGEPTQPDDVFTLQTGQYASRLVLGLCASLLLLSEKFEFLCESLHPQFLSLLSFHMRRKLFVLHSKLGQQTANLDPHMFWDSSVPEEYKPEGEPSTHVSRYRTAMKEAKNDLRQFQVPNLKEVDLVFNPGAGSGGIGLSMLQAMFSTQMVRDILITDEYQECFGAYFEEFGTQLVRDSHWETAEAISQEVLASLSKPGFQQEKFGSKTPQVMGLGNSAKQSVFEKVNDYNLFNYCCLFLLIPKPDQIKLDERFSSFIQLDKLRDSAKKHGTTVRLEAVKRFAVIYRAIYSHISSQGQFKKTIDELLALEHKNWNQEKYGWNGVWSTTFPDQNSISYVYIDGNFDHLVRFKARLTIKVDNWNYLEIYLPKEHQELAKYTLGEAMKLLMNRVKSYKLKKLWAEGNSSFIIYKKGSTDYREVSKDFLVKDLFKNLHQTKQVHLCQLIDFKGSTETGPTKLPIRRFGRDSLTHRPYRYRAQDPPYSSVIVHYKSPMKFRDAPMIPKDKYRLDAFFKVRDTLTIADVSQLIVKHCKDVLPISQDCYLKSGFHVQQGTPIPHYFDQTLRN